MAFSIINRFGEFRDNISGNFSVIAAVGSTLLIFGAAAAYETSNLVNSKNNLQNALDSAVLAAASTSGDQKTREQVGNAALARNLDFTCNKKPKYKFTPGFVEGSLDCKIPALAASLIGKKEFKISTVSEATYTSAPTFNCLHALNNTSSEALIYNNKRGPLTYVGDSIIAPECSVHVNSSSSDALFIKEDEGYSFENHCIRGGVDGDVTQLKPQPDPSCKVQISDPLATMSFPFAGGCGTGRISMSGGTAVLSPGNFCSGLDVSEDNISLNPGVYHVSGGDLTLSSDGNIIGNGVTFVMHPGSSSIEIFSKEGEINLKAPTSGTTRGFLIMDRNNSSNDHLIKTDENDVSSMYLDGIIYTPGDLMELFWRRSGVGANEKMLTFTNFGVIADRIDLHGYNQLRIDIPQDKGFLQSLFGTSGEQGEVRLTR